MSRFFRYPRDVCRFVFDLRSWRYIDRFSDVIGGKLTLNVVVNSDVFVALCDVTCLTPHPNDKSHSPAYFTRNFEKLHVFMKVVFYKCTVDYFEKQLYRLQFYRIHKCKYC